MRPIAKRRVQSGRFSFFCFAGYTLVEALTVMMVLGILAGAFTIFYRAAPQARSPEKEALHLARWLTNLTTISNRTGRSFSLICPGNVRRGCIEAEWQSPSKKDTYTSAYGCVFSRYGGSTVDSLYSPQWSALVPTITITVSREGAKRHEAEHYVIVSQHGRVRTSEYPVVER